MHVALLVDQTAFMQEAANNLKNMLAVLQLVGVTDRNPAWLDSYSASQHG